MTPRKLRQNAKPRRNVPTTLIQQSEYESDVPAYNPPPLRTNMEMNISVLGRYNPSIRTVTTHATNAVIYIFTPSTQAWEKSGVEGTLFICEQEPSYTTGNESYCIFCLNRRGLDNLILDLGQIEDVEVTSELLILRFRAEGVEESEKVMGVWIHDSNNDRERCSRVIQEAWEKAKASKLARDGEIENFNGGKSAKPSDTYEVQPEALGRRISLRDLFQQASTF